jgi:hypothetical protein
VQAAPAHIVCNVLASSGDCACELPQARGGFSAWRTLACHPSKQATSSHLYSTLGVAQCVCAQPSSGRPRHMRCSLV